LLTPTGSFFWMKILRDAKTKSFTLECSVASLLLACSVGSVFVCVWTGQIGACYRQQSERYCDLRLNHFFDRRKRSIKLLCYVPSHLIQSTGFVTFLGVDLIKAEGTRKGKGKSRVHLRKGHKTQMGSRGIALLFL
jgi:hypothetical protein